MLYPKLYVISGSVTPETDTKTEVSAVTMSSAQTLQVTRDGTRGDFR
ncbi:Uncharacterised protein [Chlamydia trachomatis]|nr:Uncharacterised protein [Chlamydia trachomatis]CRH48758.1 Uncharacterised protein [Chlamydia trachomatis]CRH87701.1 Uncharacterised protein [Chlamydia trachomatis]CRI74272.1 Uncharacterised protein [Chlamydia trachomatis]